MKRSDDSSHTMSSAISNQVAQTLQALADDLSPETQLRWVLAFSGGLDSSVLLHVLAELHNSGRLNPCAISLLHVHHGLSANADAWVKHCQLQAQHYGIAIHIVHVDAKQQRSSGVEASARSARYTAFKDFLQSHDVLLQAHHADDQLETFFLRLMRGAGIKGLAAMPQTRALGNSQLVRPLLGVSRADLEAYAKRHKLVWINDESNNDTSLDRNYLRHKILPLFAQRWPSYLKSGLQSIAWFQEQYVLRTEIAALDLLSCDHRLDIWLSESIDYRSFNALSIVRRKNLLAQWLEQFAQLRLSQQHYQSILAKGFSRTQIQLNDQMLGLEIVDKRLYAYSLPNSMCLALHQKKDLVLKPGSDLVLQGVGHLKWDTQKSPECSLEVRFKRGGERARPHRREHSQKLKKLFQEYRVPHWWRQRVPLLYFEDTLVAVGDLWIEHQAEDFLQDRISWQRSNI